MKCRVNTGNARLYRPSGGKALEAVKEKQEESKRRTKDCVVSSKTQTVTTDRSTGDSHALRAGTKMETADRTTGNGPTMEDLHD